MSAVATTLNRPDLYSAYYNGDRELLLPVIGLDAADHPLILSSAGKVTLATRARPKAGGLPYRFRELVCR